MIKPNELKNVIIANKITNPDAFVLFFHGLDSSNETTKFTCIERKLKYCQTVDYRRDFLKTFNTYAGLIRRFQSEYKHLVLAGHSLGGWFANHFAHEFNLPALLICPAIDINYRLADRILVLKDLHLSFPVSNHQPVIAMIEEEDERLPTAIAKRTLMNLPKSWTVEYFKGGHHRICRAKQINANLSRLCQDG